MRRALISAAAAAMLGGAPAAAQNSTQASPPRADAIGGDTAAGDPSGAVRALGQADGNGAARPAVTVPRLGGEGADGTRGLPAGTR